MAIALSYGLLGPSRRAMIAYEMRRSGEMEDDTVLKTVGGNAVLVRDSFPALHHKRQNSLMYIGSRAFWRFIQPPILCSCGRHLTACVRHTPRQQAPQR